MRAVFNLKASLVTATIATLIILSGCAGMSRQDKGTAAGAVVGGVIGNVVGGGLLGTGVGAAAGAVVGREVTKK